MTSSKFIKPFLMVLTFVFSSTIAFGQKTKIDKNLVHTIDSLHKADQACATVRPPDSAAAQFQRVIRTNFPVVKAILDKHGFPGYDLVGVEGSDNYFLLVQHSDFDLDFQKRALKLMKTQVKRKNATGSNYAYLIDRIEINSGRPQVYGTQVQMGRGGTKLKPCIDLPKLDKRRKKVGLSPIQAYLDRCDEVFKALNPDETGTKN